MNLAEHMYIEEILAEANAFGLKDEVQRYANKFLKEGHDYETAYSMAYYEWCK